MEKNVDVAREALVQLILGALEDKGWAVERTVDFGTLDTEVIFQTGDGTEDCRWLSVKVSAPKLTDKDGNTLYNLDERIMAYQDRVKKKAEKDKEQLREQLKEFTKKEPTRE